jgi:hypothetical protein
MIKKIIFYFLLAIAFIGFNVSNAQEASISLAPNQIMIGDHMELELKFKNKGFSNTLFPLINDTSIGNFRLVELTKIDTFFSGNEVVVAHSYKITCFEDSLQIFPSLTFRNGPVDVYTTNPIQITVNSPNIDTAKDIKPIKDIILIPLSKEEVFSYLFVSFILLALVLVLYFVYIKFIRKENLFDRVKEADPPHVEALKALKLVETDNLWQMGKIKEYYDKISDILRAYIEKRFGIKALEQTTKQLLVSMNEIQLPEYIVQDMDEILTKSDLAKFAKETHGGELHLAIMKMAYKFIQSTQLSNDVNKRTNALQVKRFYAQNKYGYKAVAINQFSFKSMIYGLITTLVLLSVTIILSYSVPINYILGLLANSTYMFFVWFVLIGVIITLIVVLTVRARLLGYWVIFDYNSVILKEKTQQKSILFKDIIESSIDKKGDLTIRDKADNKYTVPKEIEYFDEVGERIKDVSDIQPNEE